MHTHDHRRERQIGTQQKHTDIWAHRHAPLSVRLDGLRRWWRVFFFGAASCLCASRFWRDCCTATCLASTPTTMHACVGMPAKDTDPVGLVTRHCGGVVDQHFLSSCTRILNLQPTPTGVAYQGRFVAVGTFPVGIEPERFAQVRRPRLLPSHGLPRPLSHTCRTSLCGQSACWRGCVSTVQRGLLVGAPRDCSSQRFVRVWRASKPTLAAARSSWG
jgi:hypothetical protein